MIFGFLLSIDEKNYKTLIYSEKFIRTHLDFLFLTENEIKFVQIRHFLKNIASIHSTNLSHFLGNRKSQDEFLDKKASTIM